MTQRAILVMGYPASGKSGITATYANQGFEVFNRDKEGGKVEALVPKFLEALKAGQSVVADNLFLTVESRAPFIAAAQAAAVDLECHWMQTSFEDCTVNACHRMYDRYSQVFMTAADIKAHPEASKDSNIFPIAAMFAAKKRLNGVKKKGVWLTPSGKPTTAEGFSKIVKVPFVRRPYQGPPDGEILKALGVPKDFLEGSTAYATTPITMLARSKAIIVDYDGTLRRDAKLVGGANHFPVKPEEVKLLPRRYEVLSRYRDAGYLLLGVTTQSGIGKGLLTEEMAVKCIDLTNTLIGLDITTLYCKHYNFPVSCFCRKPQVGLGVLLIREYNLDPADCIFVGDMTTDRTFAARCGFQYQDEADFFAETS